MTEVKQGSASTSVSEPEVLSQVFAEADPKGTTQPGTSRLTARESRALVSR